MYYTSEEEINKAMIEALAGAAEDEKNDDILVGMVVMAGKINEFFAKKEEEENERAELFKKLNEGAK